MGTFAHYSYSQHKDKNDKKKFLLTTATVLYPANSQSSHSSSSTWILHLFKNQYLWKTFISSQGREIKLYNIHPSLLPTAKPKPKATPTPDYQLRQSKFNNLISFFWGMCLKLCYNFLSLSALSNILHHHKKVKDESS